MDLARIPTHDPLVGRVVGQMMMVASLYGEAEKVHLSGRDGEKPIDILFQKGENGEVAADGYIGSVELHQVYTPRQSRPNFDGMLFGVAGDDNNHLVAELSGTVGGRPSPES